jgi:hypothetical protein
MTLDQVRNLHPGDQVTWNDPDDGLCSKTAVIGSIEVDDDTVISIIWQDGGELECYAHELS